MPVSISTQNCGACRAGIDVGNEIGKEKPPFQSPFVSCKLLRRWMACIFFSMVSSPMSRALPTPSSFCIILSCASSTMEKVAWDFSCPANRSQTAFTASVWNCWVLNFSFICAPSIKVCFLELEDNSKLYLCSLSYSHIHLLFFQVQFSHQKSVYIRSYTRQKM